MRNDEPAFVGGDDRLRAVTGVELHEDVFDV